MWKAFRFAFFGLLLVSLIGAQKPPGIALGLWQAKVDPWVLESVQAGETEFLIFLVEQADLSGAASLRTKLEKGEYVYQRLTETARRTQGPVLAALQDLSSRSPGKVEYQTFWVANMIWARGGAQVIQALAQRADVAHLYANPHVRLEAPMPSSQPTAPDEPQTVEWNIQKINAPAAWARGFTGQGVVIGGQDTGYDWQHPALKGKYRGWNGVSANHNYNWHDAIHSGGGYCGPNSPIPCDDGYHGTHTMGTMVGDDGAGNQIGVAPGARWIGCRNMDQEVGTPATYSECYQWFIAPTDLNGANPRPDLAPDVINNSWSCPPSEGCTDPNVLKTVVENLRAAGILTVHAAGNEGNQCSTVQNPAAIYDASFTVGATDINDNIAAFSSRGPVSVDGSNRMKPDVSAPGVGVRSSYPTRYNSSLYISWNGTSMAAPHVAGLAALLLSARPDLAGEVDQLEELIAQSAVPRTLSQICGGVPGDQVPNNTYGWGRVDIWRTLQSLPRTLQISKTPSDPTYDPGQIITYTLQVAYTYPLTPTHNIVITDVIPLQTSFVSATLPHTRNGGTITWSYPSLSSNQTLTLKLAVRVSESATSVIYNQDYGARSDEVAPVGGPPVPIYRAIYYYFPWVQHNIHSR